MAENNDKPLAIELSEVKDKPGSKSKRKKSSGSKTPRSDAKDVDLRNEMVGSPRLNEEADDLECKTSYGSETGQHLGFDCDSCLSVDFSGKRFECRICDYDLCGECKQSKQSCPKKHTMVEVAPEDPDDPKGVEDWLPDRSDELDEWFQENRLRVEECKSDTAKKQRYHARLTECYRLMDVDANGGVSYAEFRAATRLLKLNSPERKAFEAVVEAAYVQQDAIDKKENKLIFEQHGDQVAEDTAEGRLVRRHRLRLRQSPLNRRIRLSVFEDCIEAQGEGQVRENIRLAVDKIYAIFTAHETTKFRFVDFMLALLPCISALLCVLFVVLQPWNDSVDPWNAANLAARGINIADSGFDSWDFSARLPSLHFVYGGDIIFLPILYAVVALHLLINISLALRASAGDSRTFRSEKHLIQLMVSRKAVNGLFILSGWVLLAALLACSLFGTPMWPAIAYKGEAYSRNLLAQYNNATMAAAAAGSGAGVVPPPFSADELRAVHPPSNLNPAGLPALFSHNRVAMIGYLTGYGFWLVTLFVQLFLRSIYTPISTWVALYRQYRLLNELQIVVAYREQDYSTGFDLWLHLHRSRVKKVHAARSGSSSFFSLANLGFVLLALIAPAIFITGPYYLLFSYLSWRWNLLDVALLVPWGVGIAMAFFKFQSIAYNSSIYYTAVEVDTREMSSMIRTVAGTPFLMMSIPQNVVTWLKVRKFVLSGSVNASQFTKSQWTFLMLSIFLLMEIVLFLIGAFRGNIGVFLLSLYLISVTAIYFGVMLVEATRISIRQGQNLVDLRKHRFSNLAARAQGSMDASAEEIALMDEAVHLLEKTDHTLMLFGVLEINRKALAGFRGLLISVAVAGFSLFDFSFLSRSLAIPGFGL